MHFIQVPLLLQILQPVTVQVFFMHEGEDKVYPSEQRRHVTPEQVYASGWTGTSTCDESGCVVG